MDGKGNSDKEGSADTANLSVMQEQLNAMQKAMYHMAESMGQSNKQPSAQSAFLGPHGSHQRHGTTYFQGQANLGSAHSMMGSIQSAGGQNSPAQMLGHPQQNQGFINSVRPNFVSSQAMTVPPPNLLQPAFGMPPVGLPPPVISSQIGIPQLRMPPPTAQPHLMQSPSTVPPGLLSSRIPPGFPSSGLPPPGMPLLGMQAPALPPPRLPLSGIIPPVVSSFDMPSGGAPHNQLQRNSSASYSSPAFANNQQMAYNQQVSAHAQSSSQQGRTPANNTIPGSQSGRGTYVPDRYRQRSADNRRRSRSPVRDRRESNDRRSRQSPGRSSDNYRRYPPSPSKPVDNDKRRQRSPNKSVDNDRRRQRSPGRSLENGRRRSRSPGNSLASDRPHQRSPGRPTRLPTYSNRSDHLEKDRNRDGHRTRWETSPTNRGRHPRQEGGHQSSSRETGRHQFGMHDRNDSPWDGHQRDGIGNDDDQRGHVGYGRAKRGGSRHDDWDRNQDRSRSGSAIGSMPISQTSATLESGIKSEPAYPDGVYGGRHRSPSISSRSGTSQSDRSRSASYTRGGVQDDWRPLGFSHRPAQPRPQLPAPIAKPRQYQPNPSTEEESEPCSPPTDRYSWRNGPKTRAETTQSTSQGVSEDPSRNEGNGDGSSATQVPVGRKQKGKARDKHKRPQDKNKYVSMKELYGTYDERRAGASETTQVPDYMQSTPAWKYLTQDPKTGNMVATTALIELEDKFEKDVVMRARKARGGRPTYKYPNRTARLGCCQKSGCSHDSEDDGTDESDMEEGEIKDDDNEDGDMEKTSHLPTEKKATYSQEVQAKIDHPERLHKLICFNDKGETNYGPQCKCSRKARRLGIRHGFYGGEKLIESCLPESSNADRLYHYRIGISPHTNLKSEERTVITWDERRYTFDGFSLFTHQKLDKKPSFRAIMYNTYYTMMLLDEDKPTMFTARSLDLVSDYIFTELLELADMASVQDEFKDGCRQMHVMPRFTRPLPDKGIELLAMPHVVRYLLENSHPVIETSQLASAATMDKKVWMEKVVKKYQFTLVTIPGMRPSTLRVDNMDRPPQQSSADVVIYPQILHYVNVSDSLSSPFCSDYQDMLKKKRKLLRALAKKVTAMSSADQSSLKELQYSLVKYQAKRKMHGTMRKERLVELSCQGFFATGLKPDVTQWGLLMPKITGYVRFTQSLTHFQENIGYQFKDTYYLQLSLSHSSYISGFNMNQDHIKNTLTNCGSRKIEYGMFPIYKELKVKKKGLKALLEIMSHKYRQYTGPIYSNERLEFLGDAVLEFLTTVHLFYLFPKLEEGALSTYRVALIKNEHLTKIAKIVGLQHYLLFSHGPDLCYSAQFDHSLANAFEALLGAIYLDGGIGAADKFLCTYLTKVTNMPEFKGVWSELPPHPLQAKFPGGDRHLVEDSPPLQICAQLEEVTGMKFGHISLLARALTHSSMQFTAFSMGTNQTLEFLGDSVLQLITSDYLFKHYANHHEGHLTLLRSSLVNNHTQADIFNDLGLARYIFKKANDCHNLQVKERADYVEAVIGALYVDQAMDACQIFCNVLFFPRLKETIENQNWNDSKSLLQQCCLELRDMDAHNEPELPSYRTVSQQGPSHSRRYRVACYFKGQRIGVGEDASIRKAQFAAAQNALDTNRAMFPMLVPGTNKLYSLNCLTHKTIKAKTKNLGQQESLLPAETYWA